MQEDVHNKAFTTVKNWGGGHFNKNKWKINDKTPV